MGSAQGIAHRPWTFASRSWLKQVGLALGWPAGQGQLALVGVLSERLSQH